MYCTTNITDTDLHNITVLLLINYYYCSATNYIYIYILYSKLCNNIQ